MKYIHVWKYLNDEPKLILIIIHHLMKNPTFDFRNILILAIDLVSRK